jgi:serine protease AprX
MLVCVLAVMSLGSVSLSRADAVVSAPVGDATVSVIVRGSPGSLNAVERAVLALGGHVGHRLSIIDGVSATVPASAVAALRASSSVVSVSTDAKLQSLTSTYDPGADVNSMPSVTAYTGAQDWWRAGYTGTGIDVAVIDSGVAPVPGLDGVDKIIYGPDLSLESQAPNLQYLDTFGHGTFMAGLIAGRDSTLTAPYDQAPVSAYRGMAPDARIVSVKVATADGGTDVSQVIAAIDWVVQHAHDPGINIRVLNLSYGTNSTQSYTLDPLAYAAEVAWRQGIVVVAAAGNSGYQRGSGAQGLADPAYDPYIIGVGGSDSLGTATVKDDLVGAFSASATGGTDKTPDFVAPGAHFQGLRVPGSYIDVTHPEGRINDRYFRGSGTSQAAAVVSGAVALILQKYPGATPDQVKAFLANSAFALAGSKKAQGDGEIQLAPMLSKSLPWARQVFTPATGTGSLELARGTDHLTRDSVVLTGEQDIMGMPFAAPAMASLETSAKSWSGGTWNGQTWSGASWSGSSWSAASWSAASWSAASWSAASWSGSSWSGASWSAASWSGASWSDASWSGASLSGASWSGASWSDASWT